MRTMTFEEWQEEFVPVINLVGENPSFQDENGEGIMYETFGIELGYVLGVNSVASQKVWTYVDGDNGTYVVDGYHLVNRLGYFITQNPRQDDQFYEVIVSQDEPERDDETV
jgi:phosphate-selective porin